MGSRGRTGRPWSGHPMEHPPILSLSPPALFLDPAPLHRIDGGGKVYLCGGSLRPDQRGLWMGTQQLRQDRTFHARIRTRPDRPRNFNQEGDREFQRVEEFSHRLGLPGFSAFYELIEWWAAELIGRRGCVPRERKDISFWDTQSDMALALPGAICCLLTITKIHDRQLKPLLS